MRMSFTPPVIFDICGLKCIALTMLIDNNKAVLLFLIMFMIQLEAVYKVNEPQRCKRRCEKQLADAPKWKDGAENTRGPTDSKKLTMLIKINSLS